MNHEEIVEAANEAINRVFGDTSVDQATTADSLEELAANIHAMLDTF